MKKALEILKHYKAKEVCACSSLYQYREGNYPIQHTSFSVKVYEEAIAELEEAMKPKTCDWCKHYDEKQCTNENSIAFGGINAVYKDDKEQYETESNNEAFYYGYKGEVHE